MIHGEMESRDIAPGTDIALNIPRFEGGLAYPNEGAGFGIELNEAFLASHRSEGRQARCVGL
jgi:L-alanine-DL-glutamate epimerase-like enolase superfamily enzyme